ncbi:MAG: hypothetical protein M3Q03_09525 [Chloroflexota bacterium]|nr:hypothetical protein [Chloroflexota bacterium]
MSRRRRSYGTLLVAVIALAVAPSTARTVASSHDAPSTLVGSATKPVPPVAVEDPPRGDCSIDPGFAVAAPPFAGDPGFFPVPPTGPDDPGFVPPGAPDPGFFPEPGESFCLAPTPTEEPDRRVRALATRGPATRPIDAPSPNRTMTPYGKLVATPAS